MPAENINVNINQNFNVGGQDQLENTNKEMDNSQKQANQTRDAFKGVRLEFLGVMFGAQQLSKSFSSMTNPISDMIGLQDLWNAQLIQSNADAIPAMIQGVQTAGEGLQKFDSIASTALGPVGKLFGLQDAGAGSFFLLAQGLSQGVGSLAQMVLLSDSLGASLGGIAEKGGLSLGQNFKTGVVPTMSGVMNKPIPAFANRGRPGVTWGKLIAGGVVLSDALIVGVNFVNQIQEGEFGKAIGSSLDAGFSVAGLIKIARGHYAVGIVLSFATDIAATVTEIGTAIGEKTASGIGKSFLNTVSKVPLLRELVAFNSITAAALQEGMAKVGLLGPEFSNRIDETLRGARSSGLLTGPLKQFAPPELTKQQRQAKRQIDTLLRLRQSELGRENIHLENINIAQRPGEDSEDLARRVSDRISEDIQRQSGGRGVTFPG